MRTIPELLTELHHESLSGDYVSMLVRFPTEQGRKDVLIFPDHSDCVSVLIDAINENGQAIGFLFVHASEIGIKVYWRPMREFADDPEITDYLQQVVEDPAIPHYIEQLADEFWSKKGGNA
jgi:hypothetical protein